MRQASHPSRTQRMANGQSVVSPYEHFSPLHHDSSTFDPINPPISRAYQIGWNEHHTAHPSNYVLARRAGREHHHDFDEQAGAEPGVNPRSGTSIAEYSHFRQDCVIDVVDYDSDEATFQRVTNADLIKLLEEKNLKSVDDDAELPPRMVRWINIGGIDWSVLSAIALKYNLHSLALEDILHERGHNHSKADYYPGHLFLRVLCHSLYLEDEMFVGDSAPPRVSPDPSKQALAYESAPTSPGVNFNTGNLDPEGGPAILRGEAVIETDSPGKSETSLRAERIEIPRINDSHKKGKNMADNGAKPWSLSRLSLTKRMTALSGFNGPARQKQMLELFALKRGERVTIKHEPMFIFLLRDGTVISIHPTPNLHYTSPITERLHRPDSVLRTSEDASLLAESLLDLIVDRILEMVDEYQVKINKLEHDILLKPDMNAVKNLHILSGDLILHKRTLEPIKTMIYGLRRYDLDRCVALADNMAMDNDYVSDTETESIPSDATQDIDEHKEEKRKAEGKDKKSKAKRRRRRRRERERARRRHQGEPPHLEFPTSNSHSSDHELQEDEEEKRLQAEETMLHQRKSKSGPGRQNIEGYFSYKAKVYLADVYDHMDFALTSLDMFAGISENLINYAFNVASYDMNMVMSRLTLVTIIFMPLTLLTGYFGMNFQRFWSVNNNSDFFFWKIALPVMAVLIPIFMYNDIGNAVSYIKRVLKVRRTVKGL